MASQVIPSGVYTIMGPGGQLCHDQDRIALMQPGYGSPQMQQWQVDFDKGKNTYTIRNMATGRYVGPGDGDDPSGPVWMLRGSSRPFQWNLMDGGDDDPDTYLVTTAPSEDALRLAPSIMRIWPPMVALAPPAPQFDFEWRFEQAR
jgi:Ricin-type beta-trefoil lectin domain-like